MKKLFVLSLFGVSTMFACGDAAGEPDASTDAGASSGSSSSSGATADAGDADGGDAGALEPLRMPAGYTQVPLLGDTPQHEFEKAEQVLQAGQDYIAVLELDLDGAGQKARMVLDLYEEQTPITVNSFVFLSLHRFYEQIAFHRVIDGFMAQTGDPNSIDGARRTWGVGGPGYAYGLEVDPALNFDAAGVLGMARTDDPNSNGSQFFITFEAASNLDQEYTVWGKVIEGLEVLPNLVRGEPPTTPSRITRVGIGVKAK